jgi:hypothetical protein
MAFFFQDGGETFDHVLVVIQDEYGNFGFVLRL